MDKHNYSLIGASDLIKTVDWHCCIVDQINRYFMFVFCVGCTKQVNELVVNNKINIKKLIYLIKIFYRPINTMQLPYSAFIELIPYDYLIVDILD
jgi:hypothetical protein